MTGRIVYTPPIPSACKLDLCPEKPDAEGLRDGTIWQCDHCGRYWLVWSGAQYNEPFSAWRRASAEEVATALGSTAQDRRDGGL